MNVASMFAFDDLPARFYSRRQILSDKVAACVLLDPSLCPSREVLPRESITCENLRAVLALSMLAASANSMVLLVSRDLGNKYVARLAGLLLIDPKKDFVLLGKVELYVAQLRVLERAEREYRAAERRASRICCWLDGNMNTDFVPKV